MRFAKAAKTYKALERKYRAFAADELVWTNGAHFEFLYLDLEKMGLAKGKVLARTPKKKHHVRCVEFAGDQLARERGFVEDAVDEDIFFDYQSGYQVSTRFLRRDEGFVLTAVSVNYLKGGIVRSFEHYSKTPRSETLISGSYGYDKMKPNCPNR
ncbi:MAG: hypothetical protein IPK60_20120 [Sandaracinaceae bacterium]|nr:hypothetical protein [Sandaracinaceae bacterium]